MDKEKTSDELALAKLCIDCAKVSADEARKWRRVALCCIGVSVFSVLFIVLEVIF